MAQNAFLDFLQAASNSAASNISGPVDLIGAGLRGMGMPVPRNALMSSQWMAERGLTKQPKNALMQVAGETAGMVSPMALAAKAPQVASALLQGGRNLAAPRTLNPQTGAIDIQALKAAFPELDVSLRQTRDIAMLDKVAMPPGARNQGRGTEFMQALTKAADEDGARIGLTPAGDFGSSVGRLQEFYKRFGFEFNKGRNKDLELMAAMVRQPSK